MQFEYTSQQSEFEHFFGGFFHISAFGKIEPGDEIKFHEFLTRVCPPPRTTIYIDSFGGEVDAAIAIGRIIRGCWFATSIGRYALDHDKSNDFGIPRKLTDGQCLSAATLIFVGGRLRHFSKEAKFGVHRFSFRDPLPEKIDHSQILSAKIATYLSDMGISPAFLEVSSGVSNSTIRLIDEAELRDLKIVTGGVTDVSWAMQARGSMLYVRGERDSIWGHHKVMLGYIKGHGFHFWAVIEAQGREKELNEFGSVEITVNGEELRIDISEECHRTTIGIYVNVMSFITQEQAKLIAYSDSFGVQIRFSKDSDLFFGISAMVTEGGKETLATFYDVLCAD